MLVNPLLALRTAWSGTHVPALATGLIVAAVLFSSLDLFSHIVQDAILSLSAGVSLLILGLSARHSEGVSPAAGLIPGALFLLFLLSTLFSGAPLAAFVGEWFGQGSGAWLLTLICTLSVGMLAGRHALLPLFQSVTLAAGTGSSLFLVTALFNGEEGFLIGDVASLESLAVGGCISFFASAVLLRTPFSPHLAVAAGASGLFLAFVGSWPAYLFILALSFVFLFARFIYTGASPVSLRIVLLSGAILLLTLLRLWGWEFSPAIAEYRPGYQATAEIVLHTLSEGPTSFLFGDGPSRFAVAWLSAYPREAASLPIWNEAMRVGYNGFLTHLIELGILPLFFFLAISVTALFFLARRVDELAPGTLALGVLFLFLAFSYLWSVPASSAEVLFALVAGLIYARAFPAAPVWGVWPAATYAAVGAALILLASWSLSSFTFYERGIGQFKSGDAARGLESLSRASAIFPSSRASRAAAEARLRLFEEELGHNPEKANALFRDILMHSVQAVERDPLSFEARITLASVHARRALLGDSSSYRLALDEYETARGLSPNHPLPHYLVAQLLFLNGERERALANAKRAVEIKPDYADALDLLRNMGEGVGR